MAEKRPHYVNKKELMAEMQKLKEKEAGLRGVLEGEKDKEVREILQQRTAELRKKFGKEFHDRLKFEIRKKEAELEQKKVELERDIQQKARSLFG